MTGKKEKQMTDAQKRDLAQQGENDYRWIPIDEKLPRGGRHWAWSPTHGLLYAAPPYGYQRERDQRPKNYWETNTHGFGLVQNVTHWMVFGGTPPTSGPQE